ncbi:MAG: transcriptional regulator, partial [bacterium]|nr:transcriptional regulator [bacterium]
KEARKAVGDDGVRQSVIKTVHGRGFRCIADVHIHAASKPTSSEAATNDAPPEPVAETLLGGKPSIAVLPFQSLSLAEVGQPIADAIPAELISALSRLRWMGVIARGSSFRFRDPEVQPQTLRQVLKVGYCLTGLVEALPSSLTVAVELTETSSGRVIWGERYESTLEGVHDVRAKIVAGVIAALETQVPLNEAFAARLLPPQHLDAWSAFHIGLQHMYRFNRADNDIAAGYFKDA